MWNNKEFTKLLETDIPPLRRKLDDGLLQELIADFHDWELATGKDEGKAGGLRLRIVIFLMYRIEEDHNRIVALHSRFAEFNTRYSGAITYQEKKEHILDFAGDLGATRRQLRGDKQAFSRWFGVDAVTHRYQKQVSALERKIAFSLERLGVMTALSLQSDETEIASKNMWRRLKIEKAVTPFFEYTGDSRVRIEAFRCLARALKVMSDECRKTCIDERTLRSVFRFALDRQQNIWIQSEALQLLESFSLDALETDLQKRLSDPSGKDDMFVRYRAVKILGNNLQRLPSLRGLFRQVSRDPSPYVRQAMAYALHAATEEDLLKWMPQLVLKDPVPQVRAVALLQVVSLLKRPELFKLLYSLVGRSLEVETDPFVLRVALKVAAEVMCQVIATGPEGFAEKWYHILMKRIKRLHCEAENLSVRRWAAQAREQMWCEFDPQARELKQRLVQILQHVRPGKKKRLPRSLFTQYDGHTFGRVLAVISQDDYGYEVQRNIWGVNILRGHRFQFRFWRFLYEFRHPSPDKRQAFSHIIGRTFSGKIHSPSGIMSELTPTKVPGEPLYMSDEAGWRPYLPLMDEILSSLDGGIFRVRPTRIYTSEGITEIAPPWFFIKRWWAKIRLTIQFSRYADLRNWQEMDAFPSSAYIQALRKLGFTISFQPYSSENAVCSVDPEVARFFLALIPLMSIAIGPKISEVFSWFLRSEFWIQLKEYFFSVYQNTLSDLGFFAALLALLFIGRSVYLKYVIRNVRKRLPLVIGGWGTRGKSSVERLKGALINALGYGVLSKTTGCEAMFLHAHTYDKMHEMFLYRPYDKATIWEQHNLARLAGRLNVDVFLWECMGLTPHYVRVLQREWMGDDLSTITNTYPDHEDLQGPAGINIPEVMTNFIPKSSVLVTTEEQMLPVLRQASETLGTRLYGVTWLDAGLLTPDILERFPYEEHPYNIALIVGMAEELGIERDFALKEIADHVIPDIGVLKVYPAAPLKSRRLEFVSGNSANERLAALSNWKRTGFDQHDLEKEPGIWMTTVVNNRADRIPRSRVFAQILVEDISADRHILIGSNLSGLQGYIKEAWDEYGQQLTLWPESENANNHHPQEILQAKARNLRIPTSEDLIKARLRAMLQGQNSAFGLETLINLWHEPETLRTQLQEFGVQQEIADSLVTYLKQDITQFEEYQMFSKQLDHHEAGQKAELDKAFQKLLEKWFHRKIVIIWDFHATANQIIHRICEETPPGLYNRIMGLQNIKGTGLDFVYSWQAWERCFTACNQLLSDNPSEINQGLRTLSAFQEYNLLCEEYARNTVEEVKGLPIAQNERFQAELTMILSNLDNVMTNISAELETVRSTMTWPFKILDFIEAFRDAGDAIKRRKVANRIYKDLAAERISHERAAMELQALNKRQKGGWLVSQLQEFFKRHKKQGVS